MYFIRAVVLSVSLFILQAGIDYFQRAHNVTGPALYADEAVIALACGAVAMYVARQRRIEKERLRLALRSLNHHVRNALQSILYADYLCNGEHLRRQVAESVVRIERAMRDISSERFHEGG